MFNKKKLSIIIIVWYISSRILSSFTNFQWNSVFAIEKEENWWKKLIAILVDKKIWWKIKGLEWYAKSYLQKKYPETKALVLNINTEEYQPFEIQKLLENLYFEWEKGQPSELIGLIIIWEIPLPVVKYNNFIFPSIYPYVDFLEQKYIRDEGQEYFINQKTEGQAEIWHGLINFKSNLEAYEKFFQKLKKYHEEPDNFIEKKIRYDDFIALQNNILEENYKLYTNKLVFAEDIAYHRYTDLLVNTLQNESTKEKADLIKGLPIEWTNSEKIIIPETKTPTKFLEEKLKALTQDYIWIIWFPLQRTASENIKATGRRNQAESHYQKIQLKDQLNLWGKNIDGIFKNINDKLESFVDQKIKKERYGMDIVIPVFAKEDKFYRRKLLLSSWLLPEVQNSFRFFFFGKDAQNITNSEESSIFRGTYRNAEKFWKYSDILNSKNNPAKTKIEKTDLRVKSLGASYDIFSQQTEGNRGFNMLQIPQEYALYEQEKTHAKVDYHCTRRRFWLKRKRVPCSRIERKPIGKCNPNAKKKELNHKTGQWEEKPDYQQMKDCENFEQFGNRIRGWASPLNATGIAENNYRLKENYDYKSAWKPIFDIAGSMKTKIEEEKAYSFKGVNHYISPTQLTRKEWAYKDPTNHAPSKDFEYFNINLDDKILTPVSNNNGNGFKIIKQKKSETDSYLEYEYKIIDSTVQHKATNIDQMNGVNKLKHDLNSESHNYYNALKNASIIEEDKYSKALISNLKDILKETEKLKTKISLEERQPQNINTNDFKSIFSNLIQDTWSIFSKYLELIKKEHTQEIISNLDSIRYQQIEKEPKIWLLKERYIEIQKNINKLEQFYEKELDLATKIFNTYTEILQQLKAGEEAIDWIIEKLRKEITNEKSNEAEKQNIKNQILIWEEVKKEVNKIKDIIDKISKIEPCRSLYWELWELLGKAISTETIDWNNTKECKNQQENTENEESKSENKKNNKLQKAKEEIKKIKSDFRKLFFPDNENPEIKLPGMNQTTQDRPIDSPRYTTFQWIGWNVIKFIYPNIFKVEAFHLSWETLFLKENKIEKNDLKEAIQAYFQNKVNEYNMILNQEKANALKDSKHFNALKNIAPLATPSLESSIRPYNLFTYEEMVNAIGGETMLNTISDLLYYHNIAVQNRIISDDILKDISNTKKAFNLNKKISYITKNYLTQENTKYLKENHKSIGEVVLPNYAAKGYEVGFINSNNNDTIKTLSNDDRESQIPSKLISQESIEADESNEAAVDSQTEKECWFDYNEALLMFDPWSWNFPRLEGFKCRLKEVEKKPFELKLIWEKNNLLENIGVIEDHNYENGFSTSNTKYQQLAKDKILGTVFENIQITNKKQRIWVEDQNSNAFWFLSLNSESEDIIVTFSSTGENCLLIDNQNTCETKVSKKLKITNPGKEVAFSLAKKTAKSFHTTLEICESNWQNCGKKTYNFTATPGAIDHFDIKLWEKNTFAAGVYNLIKLEAFDKFKNQISKSLENYTLKVNKGGFIVGGLTKSEIEISDFQNTTIIYRPEQKDNWTVHFTIIKSQDPQKKIIWKNTGTILPAIFEIEHKGEKIKKLNYQLQDIPIKNKHWNKETINENKVHKIDILLKDKAGRLLPITTRAQLYSKNNLIKTYLLEWKSKLKAASAITITKGKGSFYLMSQNTAGTEYLHIIIPWLEPKILEINILPGKPEVLGLRMEKTFVSANETVNWIISLTDKWGNPINKDIEANYTLIRPKWTFTKRILIPQGKKTITYTMEEWDSSVIFQIKINEKEKKLQTQQIIKLKENFLEGAIQSGLNIMYLNYFGSDWGNQWWYLSEHNSYGEEIIKKSDKTLAITTQLIDLKKIWKPAVLLSKEKIENLEELQIWANFTTPEYIELKIPNIGKISILDPIKESVTLKDIKQLQQSIKRRKKASIIVYDIDWNFIYKNKQLYLKTNPKQALATRGNGLSLEITSESILQLPVWEILWNNQVIGKAILSKLDFSKNNIKLENKNYQVNKSFYKGSTDKHAIGIFNQLSVLQDEYEGYDSIQNSEEIKKFIGFRGNFKNISSFAAGMSVGEATLPFGSEFLINLGDPALTRKDKNPDLKNANHNWWLGRIIYSDNKQNIFKVIDIDYNKDGLQDIIIIYNNWTIKLQKQHADKRFTNLQDLMISGEEVEEVFVWDVDGNKYEDIIIKNKKGQIRSYLNNKGIFDVDGKIACLNTNTPEGANTSNPETQSLHQLFIQDMDWDGITDILTYDFIGDIKLFYGGWGRENHSYLSKEAYKCDPERSKRQKNSVQRLKNLATSITPKETKDESLVRRAGLKFPSEEEIKANNSKKIKSDFPHWLNPWNNYLNVLDHGFNSHELTKNMVQSSEKYILNPFDKTIIEDWLLKEEQAYIPIKFLERNIDPLEVTKTYRDINGAPLFPNDKVQVSVKIKANKNIEKASFFDRLKWPWKIKLDNYNRPEDFKFLKGEATFHPQIDDSIYYLTEINLKEWETIVWNYTISFQTQAKNAPFKIKVEDINILDYQQIPKITKKVWRDWLDKDQLPDIEISPSNGCFKEKEILFNRRDNKRKYKSKNINLQELIDANNEDAEERRKKSKDETEKKIANVQKSGLEGIPWFSQIWEKLPTEWFLKKIRKEGFREWNFDLWQILNLEDLIWEELNKIEKEISDLASKTCKGFSLGSKTKNCRWLPVPFNQAFLAPGNYHIMGCLPIEPLTQTLWKGIPVFHFPGTLHTPIGPIPFPRGLKSPSDDFLWAPGGNYPSMIRIYAAPTLTAQLGIAICFGPQKIGMNIPSPLADLAGNCIVTSVALPCEDDEKKENTDWSEELETRTKGYKDLGACQSDNQNSPFLAHQNNNTPITFEQDSVSFEGKVIIPASQEIPIPNITIGGIGNTKNKILWGNEKGIKAIVGNFLYNQIEYLKNNLLRWHLNLYLPDFAKLNKEIQDLSNTSKNFEELKLKFEKVWLKTPFTNRITKGQINKLWLTEDNNPFLQIKKLFNESELINISTQNIAIHIPRIYGEDIEAYSNYLKTWGETQKSTIETRKNEIQWIIGSCPTQIARLKGAWRIKELEQKLEECKTAENISTELLKLTGKFDKASKQILQNIETLELYKRFPFEIYERLHIVDKYMAEISWVINNFFGYLNFWMDINASRFSQYVDAIITSLAVVKTYQILIDITANRSSKCGTCTNDTYDQYTCKLGFLCNGIKIDPIPIPNLKIPNLNIDISNIDTRLDIVLPNFEFIPKSIELPRLANIPLPPAVGLKVDRDFNIPNIPQLPEPPTLPELPSLLPQVQLKLPILPPAPKIPELPKSISSTLKIIEKIWKIYCIIKQGFGLVGESSVKAKIEQITQRTYDVPRVDHLDLLSNFEARLWKTNLKGVDYGIESHLNLQYNFDQFYAFLKGTADAVNNYTDIATNFASNASNKATTILEKTENWIQNKIDEWGEYLNVNINIKPENLNSYLGETQNHKNITKVELTKQLQASIKQLQSPIDQQKFKTILALTQKPTQIQKDQNKLNKMKNQISNLISNRKKDQLQLAQLAKEDYKDFLLALAPYKNKQQPLQLSFNGALLKPNQEIESLLKNNNIKDIYIATQEQQIDGYLKALETNTPDFLNMSPYIHQKNTNYLKNIKKEIKKYYFVKNNKKNWRNTLIRKGGEKVVKDLYAQTDIQSTDYIWELKKAEIQIPMNTPETPDYSHYIKGVLLKTKDQKSLINVVNSEHNYEQYQNYYEKDMNRDGKDDLILRDQNTVYIKYANDLLLSEWKENKYYEINLSLENKKQKYEKAQNSFFKVYDEAPEVKNFGLKGQTFDTLSFAWENNQNIPLSGYLMRIADRIDNHREKKETELEKYILFLPKNTALTGINLEIKEKNGPITELIKNKTLHTIKYYDPQKRILEFGISEVPRKWQYVQITSLEKKWNIYKKNAPRSNQEIWGRQVITDTEPPVATASLLRIKKKYEAEDQGNNLEGRVGSYYDLHIAREDNVQVDQVELQQEGKTLVSKVIGKPKGEIRLQNLFFTRAEELNYIIKWKDTEGNSIQETITLKIKIPKIKIDNISRLTGRAEGLQKPIIIDSSIEQEIDEGTVNFQKKRNEVITDISAVHKGKTIKNFKLKTNQTQIKGKYFDFGNLIGLYNTNKEQYWSLNPENGEIKINKKFSEKVETSVHFNKGYPIIQLNEEGKKRFEIILKAQELIKATALEGKFQTLKWNQYGVFNGGQALMINKKAILFVSKTGAISTNTTDLIASYRFNPETETVTYRIKEHRFGKDIAELEIKTLAL